MLTAAYIVGFYPQSFYLYLLHMIGRRPDKIIQFLYATTRKGKDSQSYERSQANLGSS